MMKRSLLSAAIGAAFLACGLAVWAVTTPLDDWKIAGPFGGTAISVTLDPHDANVVLAGAMNSLLFRSRDAGQNWELLDFPKQNLSEVTSVLVDPSDSKHYLAGVIAANGGGLFNSQDQGATWTGVAGMQDFGVRSLAVAPSTLSRFVAGTMHGVMMSEDSGKTWVRISDPQNLEMRAVTAVAIDPQDPDIIYAGTSHLPWKTTDGGKTWQSIHTGMVDDSDVFSIYVDPLHPTAVFASACSGIYSSANRGDQWRKLMGIPNTSRRTHVIRLDPVNGNILFAGTTTGLYKSVNLGTTWKTITNTQVNAMVFDPSHAGSMYLAMQYEGVGKGMDSSEAVDMINRGFVDRPISSVTRSGDKLLAIETQLGESSGIFVSSDRGETWTQKQSVRGLAGVHLITITGMPSEERILLAAGPHQMYKSIDGGALWKPLPVRLILPPLPEPARPTTTKAAARGKKTVTRKATRPVERIREIAPSDIAELLSMKNGTKDLLFAATGLGLLQSSDSGEHWKLTEMPAATAVSALYVAPNSDGRLIARASTGLFLSKDFGDHWTQLAFPLSSWDVNDVAIPADAGAPLLVATRVGLYSSPDGGSKWYANAGGMPASTVSSVLYCGAEKMAYAVEYGRLYESSDEGGSWKMVPSCLPATRIRKLWIADSSSKRVYGITNDLGVLFRN